MDLFLENIYLIIAALLLLLSLPRIAFFSFLCAAHIYRRLNLDAASKNLPYKNFALFPFFWHEATALIAVTKWNLFTSKKTELLDRCVPDTRPILLVHGYSQDHSNFVKMRQNLEQKLGRTTAVVFLGKPRRSTAKYADALENKVEALLLQHGTIDIVCHSMGGLILRVLLQRKPQLAQSINLIITLGTPHYGTASARHLTLSILGKEIKEMRPNSETLKNLKHITELVQNDRVIAISAPQDYVVYPETTCYPPQIQKQHSLPTCGHAGLLVHQESIELVTSLLQS